MNTQVQKAAQDSASNSFKHMSTDGQNPPLFFPCASVHGVRVRALHGYAGTCGMCVCRGQRVTLTAFHSHFPSYVSRLGLSLNLKCTHSSTSLAWQAGLPQRSPASASAERACKRDAVTTWHLCVCWGFELWPSYLARQALHQLCQALSV